VAFQMLGEGHFSKRMRGKVEEVAETHVVVRLVLIGKLLTDLPSERACIASVLWREGGAGRGSYHCESDTLRLSVAAVRAPKRTSEPQQHICLQQTARLISKRTWEGSAPATQSRVLPAGTSGRLGNDEAAPMAQKPGVTGSLSEKGGVAPEGAVSQATNGETRAQCKPPRPIGLLL
jgi:hypothetical protein